MTAADALAAGPLPSAQPAAPNAMPKILGVHLSSLRVRGGDVWSGKIATTTNVASVEVRAPSFTFNAPRIAYGQFAFDIHALFVPPIYRRIYTVAIVARNANGISDERDIDVDFR
jgi:hypothetical protein